MAVRSYVSAARLGRFAARRRLLLNSLFSLGLLGLATAGFFWQILLSATGQSFPHKETVHILPGEHPVQWQWF